MSLPHALLISLIEKPCSGLELSERFDRSIGNYWHATHQQIYRELARLEVAGWVEARPIESARGNKKEYCVLTAGRKELRRWTGETREIEPYRSELMVRLRAEAALGPCGLAADIERRLEMHRKRCARYQAIEKRNYADPAAKLSRSEAIAYLILKKGIMNELVWIDWSIEALKILGQEQPARRPGAKAGLR